MDLDETAHLSPSQNRRPSNDESSLPEEEQPITIIATGIDYLPVVWFVFRHRRRRRRRRRRLQRRRQRSQDRWCDFPASWFFFFQTSSLQTETQNLTRGDKQTRDELNFVTEKFTTKTNKQTNKKREINKEREWNEMKEKTEHQPEEAATLSAEAKEPTLVTISHCFLRDFILSTLNNNDNLWMLLCLFSVRFAGWVWCSARRSFRSLCGNSHKSHRFISIIYIL